MTILQSYQDLVDVLLLKIQKFFCDFYFVNFLYLSNGILKVLNWRMSV